MGGDQFVLGIGHFVLRVTATDGDDHRIVKAGFFSHLLKVVVHLLVRDGVGKQDRLILGVFRKDLFTIG